MLPLEEVGTLSTMDWFLTGRCGLLP